MFCKKCGKQLNEEAKFCNKCGTEVAPMPSVNMASPNPNSNTNKTPGFFSRLKRLIAGHKKLTVGACAGGLALVLLLVFVFAPFGKTGGTNGTVAVGSAATSEVAYNTNVEILNMDASQYPQVTVNVAVTDEAGNAVPGLTTGDLRVGEAGAAAASTLALTGVEHTVVEGATHIAVFSSPTIHARHAWETLLNQFDFSGGSTITGYTYNIAGGTGFISEEEGPNQIALYTHTFHSNNIEEWDEWVFTDESYWGRNTALGLSELKYLLPWGTGFPTPSSDLFSRLFEKVDTSGFDAILFVNGSDELSSLAPEIPDDLLYGRLNVYGTPLSGIFEANTHNVPLFIYEPWENWGFLRPMAEWATFPPMLEVTRAIVNQNSQALEAMGGGGVPGKYLTLLSLQNAVKELNPDIAGAQYPEFQPQSPYVWGPNFPLSFSYVETVGYFDSFVRRVGDFARDGSIMEQYVIDEFAPQVGGIADARARFTDGDTYLAENGESYQQWVSAFQSTNWAGYGVNGWDSFPTFFPGNTVEAGLDELSAVTMEEVNARAFWPGAKAIEEIRAAYQQMLAKMLGQLAETKKARTQDYYTLTFTATQPQGDFFAPMNFEIGVLGQGHTSAPAAISYSLVPPNMPTSFTVQGSNASTTEAYDLIVQHLIAGGYGSQNRWRMVQQALNLPQAAEFYAEITAEQLAVMDLPQDGTQYTLTLSLEQLNELLRLVYGEGFAPVTAEEFSVYYSSQANPIVSNFYAEQFYGCYSPALNLVAVGTPAMYTQSRTLNLVYAVRAENGTINIYVLQLVICRGYYEDRSFVPSVDGPTFVVLDKYGEKEIGQEVFDRLMNTTDHFQLQKEIVGLIEQNELSAGEIVMALPGENLSTATLAEATSSQAEETSITPPDALTQAQGGYRAYYESYLRSIQAKDANLMEYCTPNMVERQEQRIFGVNLNHVFENREMYVDQDTLQLTNENGRPTLYFTVMCVNDQWPRGQEGRTPDTNEAPQQVVMSYYEEAAAWLVESVVYIHGTELGPNRVNI